MSRIVSAAVAGILLTTTFLGTTCTAEPRATDDRYQQLLEKHEEIRSVRQTLPLDSPEQLRLCREYHQLRWAMHDAGYTVPTTRTSVAIAAQEPSFAKFDMSDPVIQRAYRLTNGDPGRMERFLDWEQQGKQRYAARRALVVQNAMARAAARRARLGRGPAPTAPSVPSQPESFAEVADSFSGGGAGFAN